MDDQPRTFNELIELVDQCFAEATPAPWAPGHVATKEDRELFNVIASAWPLFKNRMSAMESELFQMRRSTSEMACRLDDAQTQSFIQEYMLADKG